MRGKIVYSRDGKACQCFIEGKEVSRAEFDLAFPPKPLEEAQGVFVGNTPSCWPMKSEAMAVSPKSIQHAMNDAKARGVPTEFDPEDGCPILTDRAHRKAYNRAYGYHDKHGGYGD